MPRTGKPKNVAGSAADKSLDKSASPNGGNGVTTIVEVASLAGVSLGTVSRVTSGNQTVAPALRERVKAAMRTLGYVPNPAAQSMRTRSTRVVGCMVSDISNPLFASTVSAAEDVLSRSGYSMTLSNSRDRPDTEAQILTLFQRRRFDGLIITLSKEDDPVILDILSNSTVPTVLIERECSLPFDTVCSDHYSGTVKAVDYLLRLGHRRIGLVTVTQAALPGRQRAQGFIAAHQRANVEPDPALMSFDGFLLDASYQAAYRMLVSRNPPTAILAGVNQMQQVLKAVQMLNLSIPQDLSIVMLGDTEMANLYKPALTVVRWDNQKVGAAAAELLLSRLSPSAQTRQPQQIVIPTELVLRESCAQVRAA